MPNSVTAGIRAATPMNGQSALARGLPTHDQLGCGDYRAARHAAVGVHRPATRRQGAIVQAEPPPSSVGPTRSSGCADPSAGEAQATTRWPGLLRTGLAASARLAVIGELQGDAEV